MGVNDVSEAVVEVAWAALNTQQEAELKELLAVEVIENDKLRRSLKVYEKVIEDLELADAVAAARIEDSSSDSASTASCQEPRTPDMYDKLRDKLSSPEFLQQLASNEGEKPVDPSVMRGGDQEKGLWMFVSDDNVLPKEERDELGTNEGYVVITQQDIVDGVACFVARSISSLPQSKTMSPDELQQAFSELQKTGKLRNLWSCAHLLYAATSWGSTALGLYKNPVIRRAAWMAVYTSSSIILRLFP
ncbi:hypothetical protein M758_9G160200 [Ceratodon purpureus]|nr:hypothetical protein M758_9G160200 [Ceratodon purpureus]